MPDDNKPSAYGQAMLICVSLRSQLRFVLRQLPVSAAVAGTSDRLWKQYLISASSLPQRSTSPVGAIKTSLISLIGLNALQPRLTCKE